MKDTINILFLGGAKRVSVAEEFIKAGKQLGKMVNIFSYELTDSVPISFIGKVIIGRKWKDADVTAHLNQVIKENSIHIIIPFVDPATVVAARLKEEGCSAFIPVSSPQACSVFFNKIKANEWFISSNMPVPVSTGRPPLIAKPAFGSASKGIVVLRTKEDIEQFRQNFTEDDYLLQRYVDADEYSVDCYVSPRSKNVICIVPRKRIEVTSGEVTQTVTRKDQRFISLSRQMLELSGLEGPVTIQFLEEKNTKEVYFMEVNPRFGGGVMAAIGAGANIPLYVLRDYLNASNEEEINWQDNLLMMRTYREFYRYADNN